MYHLYGKYISVWKLIQGNFLKLYLRPAKAAGDVPDWLQDLFVGDPEPKKNGRNTRPAGLPEGTFPKLFGRYGVYDIVPLHLSCKNQPNVGRPVPWILWGMVDEVVANRLAIL